MSTQCSVVIPTYNAADYIRAALESIFAQTLPPSEIITVDDGSKDGTRELVAEVARRAPVPIRQLRMPVNSGGPARPLNRGVAEASNGLVAILEQDDLMAPRRLEWQVAAAERFPECVIVAGRPAIVTEADGEQVWAPVPPPADIPQFAAAPPNESFVVPSDVAFRSLMGSNFIYSNSNVLLRKREFTALGGFNPRWPINSDADFEFRALMAGPIAIVNAVVCGYRSRPDSLYHSRSRRARIHGLLIRLAWGSKRRDWAAEEVERVYWALRADVRTLLAAGEYRLACEVIDGLLRSAVSWQHVTRKLRSRAA